MITVTCQSCRAEVAEGQRFCRLCGAEVRSTANGESPTRIFPAQAQAGGAQDTSSLAEPRTDPVYNPSWTAPQRLAGQPTTILTAPRRAGSSRLWLFVMAGVGLLLLACIAVLLFVSQQPPTPQRIVVMKDQPTRPTQPPRPPVGPAGALPLDEKDAEVSGDKIVITKAYPLQSGATVSLKNVSGDIKVEGWDETQAEVKIIKSGGSAEQREAVHLSTASGQNRLSFETPLVGVSSVEVRYELKLPRNVSLSVVSLNSDVKLSELNGSIGIDLQKGSIELQQVGGTIKAKTIKGDIKAELDAGAQKGSQEFSTIKGDVELQFDGEINTDLKAITTDGKIDLDEDFNLQVEKSPVGQHVAGRIGAGGNSLLVTTVNGNIKLKN